MQDKVYTLNLSLKFMYVVPNQTAPNWITLNWTMHSQDLHCQIIMCKQIREQGMTNVN